MRQELDDLLVKKYPVIFQDRHGDMRHTAMCWGFDVNDGWFDLIDGLCNMIQHHMKYNAKPGTPPFIAEQVKEKFGTLRFYFRGGDATTDAFVRFAEFYSGRVCDICGKPGKLGDGGWLATRCEEHQ